MIIYTIVDHTNAWLCDSYNYCLNIIGVISFTGMVLGEIFTTINRRFNPRRKCKLEGIFNVFENHGIHFCTCDKLDYLQTLLEDFLIEFTHLYPEQHLTPKMHYLIHIPAWMKRLA